MDKLKIWLVLDERQIDIQLATFILSIKSCQAMEITGIFVLPRPRVVERDARRLKKLILTLNDCVSKSCFKTLVKGEGAVLKFLSRHMQRLSVIDVSRQDAGVVAGIAVLQLGPTGMPEQLTSRVSQVNTDLILNLGSCAVPDQLLGKSRLGALQLNYHQDHTSTCAPVGFWETYYRIPITKFSINRIVEGAATYQILRHGSFRTQFCYLLNQTHLYRKVLAQLHQMLVSLVETHELPEPRLEQDTKCAKGAKGANATVLDRPSVRITLSYFVKLHLRLSRKVVRRAFRVKEEWGIQIANANWSSAANWDALKISAPTGHFWADPFLRTNGGKTYCFVEDFLFSTKRGHISVLEVSENGVADIGIALKEDFHLSFPFMFEYDGKTFMCPETAESNQIRLYECTEFPLRWQLCKIIMNDVSAADSMLFEHNGKWWMLTSIDRTELNDHCSELCLFFADSPLTDKWEAHPRNPIYVDANIGRNAGLIIENGRILRAAQEQGFDQYGKGAAVYEIVKLDMENFEEVKVNDLEQLRPRNCLASHHISTTGRVTVVDYLTHRFSP
jgi:hypothetical protein